MSQENLADLKHQFRRAMLAAQKIFGKDAFRKRYNKEQPRYAINKALFESWAVTLSQLSDDQIQALQSQREQLISKFIALMNTTEFNHAVSLGTGHPRQVKTRFASIKQIIQETLS